VPPKISKRAARTWDRLRQWYGARVAEQYGAVPPLDWCAIIDRTDDERIETALATVRRESPAHPPTLGQLEAAIPKRDLWSNNQRSQIDQFADFAVSKLTRIMCQHQVAMRWNFFGPVRQRPGDDFLVGAGEYHDLAPRRIGPRPNCGGDRRGAVTPEDVRQRLHLLGNEDAKGPDVRAPAVPKRNGEQCERQRAKRNVGQRNAPGLHMPPATIMGRLPSLRAPPTIAPCE